MCITGEGCALQVRDVHYRWGGDVHYEREGGMCITGGGNVHYRWGGGVMCNTGGGAIQEGGMCIVQYRRGGVKIIPTFSATVAI